MKFRRVGKILYPISHCSGDHGACEGITGSPPVLTDVGYEHAGAGAQDQSLPIRGGHKREILRRCPPPFPDTWSGHQHERLGVGEDLSGCSPGALFVGIGEDCAVGALADQVADPVAGEVTGGEGASEAVPAAADLSSATSISRMSPTRGSLETVHPSARSSPRASSTAA